MPGDPTPRGARQPQSRIRPIHLIALLVALFALLYDGREAGRPFSPQEELANVQFTIFLAAEAVNAYRDSTGELPQSLRLVGAEEEGLGYWTDGDIYSLTARAPGGEVVYRDGESLLPYATAYDRVVPE